LSWFPHHFSTLVRFDNPTCNQSSQKRPIIASRVIGCFLLAQSEAGKYPSLFSCATFDVRRHALSCVCDLTLKFTLQDVDDNELKRKLVELDSYVGGSQSVCCFTITNSSHCNGGYTGTR
jgi:hypothetical protein